MKALGQEFGDELTAGLTAALAGTGEGEETKPPAGPRSVVEAAVDSYVGLIDRDPALYRFITDRLTNADAEMEDLIELLSRNVALALGDALRAVGADSGAAEPWAYGLIGMVHAAGDWWVTRRTIPREQLVEYLVTLCWDGMGVPTRSGRLRSAPTNEWLRNPRLSGRPRCARRCARRRRGQWGPRC